jgi:hypothetical protein
MRWEGLFDDLAAQWDGEERRGRDAEVADRTRRERAEVTLVARVGAHRDVPLRLRLVTGRALDGEVADVGADWVLLRRVGARREALVPVAAVTGVLGLGPRTVEPGLARRVSLGYALRALSRDRSVVALTDTSDLTVTGTIDSVGADALDLAEHPADDPRREANVRGTRTVPFAAIVVVEAR